MNAILPLDAGAVLFGAVLAVGVVLLIGGAWPRAPRLKVALAELDALAGQGVVGDASDEARLVEGSGERAERLAARLFQRWRLPLSRATRHRLAQQGRSVGDLFVAKLTLAVAGLFVPVLLGGALWMLGLVGAPWPFGVGLVGAVVGYMWPDWQLRQAAATWREHSADAISVYFDLVTLIRLGNASAVQSLREAAELSSAPVFAEMRDALDRARLQQRPPWAELNRLAAKLGLPEVADLASIMALDQQGAALVDALRARVKELRRAHLAAAKLAAQKRTESMTVWMVVPVLIFALIFLIPPIMTMVAGM